MRRFVLLFLSLALGCSDASDPAAKPDRDMGSNPDLPVVDMSADDMADTTLVSLAVTPNPATVPVGDTLRLQVEGLMASGRARPVSVESWTSSDDAIVEVTTDGVLIGREIGSATVEVAAEGLVEQMPVQVQGLPVASMTLRPATGTILIGDSIQLVVDLFDAQNAAILDARPISYVSSDEGILNVDAQGRVTAVASGSASVSVSVEGVTETASFDVPDVTVESVSVTPPNQLLIWGDTATVQATVTYDGPEPANPASIQWTSSATDVVAVDVDGNLTAVAGGTATITATAGGVQGTATVSVTSAFSDIDGGGAHVCGLIQKRAVCWGRATEGQLGHNAGSAPARVALDEDLAQIATGGNHTCAVTETTGAVYCWGDDSHGQLGNGAGGSTSQPTPIAIAANGEFKAIVAGDQHTCAVKLNGDLHCWGNGAGGRLGNAGSSDLQTPVFIGAYDLAALGREHTCGVNSADQAFCWGVNVEGRLGNNATSTSEPSPVQVLGGYEFAAVELGDRHSCGVTVVNTLACWGANDRSQIGDATSNNRFTPILVPTPTPLTRIAAGALHTCGLSAQGQAYCWGAFDNGVLGQNTNVDLDVPTPITSTTRFFAIAAGDAFTCALATGGIPYCWGDGSQGQLGASAGSFNPERIAPF